MADKELPTEAAIVEAFNNGTLVEWIFTDFGHLDSRQQDSVIAMCAALHNSGAIDILGLALPEILAPIEPAGFIDGQQFFCELIPRLSAPAEPIMEAVIALVEKGGNDFAANEPNRAFREWCAGDLSRAHEVIRLARDGAPSASKLMAFALEARSLADEAMDLIAHPSREIRLSAVTALGRMALESADAPLEVLHRLAGVLDERRDEDLACNVLVTALSVTRKSETVVDDALAIATRVTEVGGSAVHSCCAHALSSYGQDLPDEIVDVLLEALLQVGVSNKPIIRQLDNALRNLLDSEHGDRALEFVRRLMTSASGALEAQQFEGFGRRLKREPKERLWPTLISWLLSGERTLCEWLPVLVEAPAGKDEPLEIPANALELGDREKYFLARKIIGYLFINPVTCASLLVSILRTCDGEAAGNVERLLYEPMLVNYSGVVREYLEALAPSDPVHARVRSALEKADRLASDLLPRDAIKELHPSEHERQISYQAMADETAAIWKKVESESVLLSLVSRSVVLYGRRSLSYIDVPGHARRPFEVDLHPHGVSFEIPRLQMVDPVGLDYMLRRFRGERLMS